MADINSITLTGGLTKDSELTYTKNNTALLKFSLGSNRRVKVNGSWTDKANYFDCILWGKLGESLAKHLKRGSQVCLSGIVDQERWESNGQKRSRHIVEVLDIKLMGGMSKNEKPQGQPEQKTDYFEDDVPF